ncbi:MAG: Anthranilate phosphoribosyltransferase [Acidimicrobiaceae bacterium]|nr:Anthranilate phosphoribosyltransferase [Acidimicrobiaceae bacterium]
MADAAAAFEEILAGRATPAQTAAFAAALRTKGETVEELTGFVAAMRAYGETVTVSATAIDTCGTGGDRSGTINVSTLAALVAAGAGAKVCKHGGRAATSKTGSADVLEALGVVIDLGPAGVERCVEEAGMGFCLAVRYHPAMRHAATVRRELGTATVFNFLGPLVNPGRVSRQTLGVGDPTMAEKMVGVLRANGAVRAMVFFGHDGLDELSTVAPSTVIEIVADASGETDTRTYVVDPARLGLSPANPDSLRGGDPRENADRAREILSGADGPQRDLVALNAAAALVVAGLADDLAAGLDLACTALDSGAAAATLDKLVAVSSAAAEEAER